MRSSTSDSRYDASDRVIALSLVLLAAVACGSDSTSPTTATSFTILSGSLQSGTVGTALAAPVVVRVADQSGNPLAGVAVTFTPAAASGSASSSTVTTDSTGSAQVSWTLGTVTGTDTMAVTVGTLPSAAVLATATPDVPASITIVGGNNQSAPAGTLLSAVLSVKLTDKYGNVVPNAVVAWSDDAGGAFTAPATTTDINGVAQDSYTLGPVVGADDVVATVMVNGAPMSATFLEQAN